MHSTILLVLTQCALIGNVGGRYTGCSNLALKKPTMQSTTHESAISSRAVDGDRNSAWSGNSCTATGDNDSNPWWAADLGTTYKVDRIELSTRDILSERNSNLVFGITNTSPSATSRNFSGLTICDQGPATVAAGQLITVNCKTSLVPTRYVVVLSPQPMLTICELEVFGSAIDTFRCELDVVAYSGYESPSCIYPNDGHVSVNGHVVWEAGWCSSKPNLRGINTMILDPTDCSVADQRQFDTWENATNTRNFIAYLDYVRTGALLVGVTGDEPMQYLELALPWLQAAGVQVNDVQYRGSFAFVIQIGYPENTVFVKSLTFGTRTSQLRASVQGDTLCLTCMFLALASHFIIC